MMPRLLLLLSVVLGTVLVPSVAHAYVYTFCVRVNVDLYDDQIGEDWGLGEAYNGQLYWRMRGARYKLYDTVGNKIRDGYLDGNGCTDPISTPYYFDFDLWFYSYGNLEDGNKLYVRSGSTGDVGTYNVAGFYPGPYSGVKDIYHTSNVVLPRMYAVYAYTINDRFRDMTRRHSRSGTETTGRARAHRAALVRPDQAVSTTRSGIYRTQIEENS